jgi:hypothetical protein
MFQTSSKELFQKYPNPVFIESGTYYGDGAQAALDAGFKTVCSIELSQELYLHCKQRFKKIDNVIMFLGDSQTILNEILDEFNEPITFWLDGHWAGEGTAKGKYESPLIQELEIIGKYHKDKSIILIDDLRCWKKDIHGFDLETIIRKCLEINPKFQFSFENGYVPNDILVVR